MKPKVVIIVLNWNLKDITIDCVASLLESDYENLEIVVIDNGSHDGSEEAIRERFPDVPFVQNGENLGYAGGNNRGFQWALDHGADYVFVLNNDTKLKKDCVSQLVAAAERNPTYGIFGPVAYEYHDPSKPMNSGLYLTLSPDKEVTSFYTHIPGSKILKQKGDIADVDLVRGDAFFVKREVLERIGFFDARFFLLQEEYDLCVSAKEAGYSIAIVRDAGYLRMTSASMPQTTPQRTYYTTRNSFLFIAKHARGKRRRQLYLKNLKMIKWSITGFYLPNMFKAKKFSYARNIIAMAQGCLDYKLKRFGRRPLFYAPRKF